MMTERTDLIALVEALADTKVVCLGDVMLDTFVHGEVERISPEAPIPVLRVTGDVPGTLTLRAFRRADDAELLLAETEVA